MRPVFFVLLVVVSGMFAFGEKVATLTEVMKPGNIQVDDTQIYIPEDATIYIYSLKDYQLVKKFGRAGEGPGEFRPDPRLKPAINVSTDDIIVNSLGKISYFSKDGIFKKEINCAFNSFIFQPMGNQFLGTSQAAENNKVYNTVNLYDSQLKKIKEIYRAVSGFKGPGKGAAVLQKVFWFQYYQNKIFLPGETDASIDVFDKNTNKQFTIHVESKKQPVTPEFKKEVINYLKTSREYKDLYEIAFKPVQFPGYFPTIQYFFGDDNMLYVMTWQREKGKNEFQLFDMKGKFLKKVMIPLKYQDCLSPFPLDVKNGKVYQLVENMDEEEWELHVSDL